MHQYVALEDTVYFGFSANLTSGAGDDGATPLFDVRLGGAAAGAAPVLSGTPTLLTHANYLDGSYEVAIAATAVNGFAAGNTYLVFVTLTISGVTPGACIGSFRTAAVPANVTQLGGVAQSLTDLKDFADDGYDPSTNKVQGVVLTDTVTTYTGNTPQTGDAYARLGAPAGASVSVDIAAVKTDTGNLISRLGAWTGSGLNTVLGALRAIAAKAAALTPTDLSTGTTFDNTTDSAEAIRDRGDAAWTTATGFSTLTEANVRTAVGLVAANLDTQLDALPTATENADALLKRDWTAVTGEAARSCLNAFRFLRNKWSISVTTLTVTKEDDVTAAWTSALTADASADPITGSDPA